MPATLSLANRTMPDKLYQVKVNTNHIKDQDQQKDTVHQDQVHHPVDQQISTDRARLIDFLTQFHQKYPRVSFF